MTQTVFPGFDVLLSRLVPLFQRLSGWRLWTVFTAGIILAVGARPCSGALIVLVFALVNGLLLAGIASTLAMALGTAVTVSALAALSVQAKLIALRLFSVSGVNMRLLSGMLWLGGGTVIATMGIGMFLAPSPVAPF